VEGGRRGKHGPLLARVADLLWVIDLQPEIDSDLSVFHGIREPMEELCSSRYFELVALLPHYDGAVRFSLVRLAEKEAAAGPPQPGGPPMPASATGTRVMPINDVATVAAMSQAGDARARGFPTIGYKGG
jgi:hypothetical protein